MRFRRKKLSCLSMSMYGTYSMASTREERREYVKMDSIMVRAGK